MINPHEEIRDYLSRLINQLLYIQGLHEQLKIIEEWESQDKYESLDIGRYFFRLVAYSFNRTILIELSKLFSDKEQKSIIDFLKKAKENASSISPTTFDREKFQRVALKLCEYKCIIDEQMKKILSKEVAIRKIKAHRDKALAHSDAEFFLNPGKLNEKYPLEFKEVDELMEIAIEILRYQNVYLFESDLDIKVYSTSNVESVLQYVRAFKRILEDEIIGGAKNLKYKWDSYQ